MWSSSSWSTVSSSASPSSAPIASSLPFFFLDDHSREKNPRTWDLVSQSSLANKRSPFSILAFHMSLATCPGSSFLPDLTTKSNFYVRYCLTLSENRTAPPFGLWRAQPSFKSVGDSSAANSLTGMVDRLPSAIVREENFSTQFRRSLSYTLSVCWPTDICRSRSSIDLKTLAHPGTGHSRIGMSSVLSMSQLLWEKSK